MTGFVSGLQDDRPAPHPDARGQALLDRIRAHAAGEAETLALLTIRRFDGAEWLDPDPADVAAWEAATATVRLVDLIVADRRLCAMVTYQLARGAPR